MRSFKNTLFTGLFVFLLANNSGVRAADNTVQADVRLLIDISGSMKGNDPKNLRIPALQLVTNLMPKGGKAGVWAFGRYVNMLVPLDKVDTTWQDKATLIANKINSAGLFTNIGGVLEKASYGWDSENSNERRSIILLTDGMVDISKNAADNQKERARILNSVLPKLKLAKVVIHTIALSQNADHDLLKTLSTQTDGWYQAVDSAEELQKVFLKIFEQAAVQDSLPLKENRFNVDTSVEEITLLVFKKNEEATTQLSTPKDLVLDKKTKDRNVRWFNSETYDLITIKNPEIGSWQIQADIDPDNRVMVVSKLGLAISDIPNNVLAGEAINYQVSLMEDGEQIKKVDFLQLVKAQLVQSKQQQTSRLAMFYDAVDHQFKQNFFTDSSEGILNLTLEVKSPTFERTRNHAINVYGSPLIDEITLSDDENIPHSLKLSVREDIVNANSIKVSATLTLPDGEKQFLVLDNLTNAIPIRTYAEGGKYSVALDIKGTSILGREFSVTPAAIEFVSEATAAYKASLEQSDNTVIPPVVEPPVTVVETPPKIEPPVEKTKLVEPIEPDDQPPSWSFWLYIGLAINLLLGVVGFFTWKFLKKRNLRASNAVANELGLEDDLQSEQDENDVSGDKR